MLGALQRALRRGPAARIPAVRLTLSARSPRWLVAAALGTLQPTDTALSDVRRRAFGASAFREQRSDDADVSSAPVELDAAREPRREGDRQRGDWPMRGERRRGRDHWRRERDQGKDKVLEAIEDSASDAMRKSGRQRRGEDPLRSRRNKEEGYTYYTMEHAAQKIAAIAQVMNPRETGEVEKLLAEIAAKTNQNDPETFTRSYNGALREVAAGRSATSDVLEALVDLAPRVGVPRSSWLLAPLVFYYCDRNDPRWRALHAESQALAQGGVLPIAYWRKVAAGHALRGEMQAGVRGALVRAGAVAGGVAEGLVDPAENFARFHKICTFEPPTAPAVRARGHNSKAVLVAYLGGALQELRLAGAADAGLAVIARFVTVQCLARSRDLAACEAFVRDAFPELEAAAAAVDAALRGPDGHPVPPAEAGARVATTVRVGSADLRHGYMLAASSYGFLLLAAAHEHDVLEAPRRAPRAALDMDAADQRRAERAWSSMAPAERAALEARGRRLLLFAAGLALKPFQDEWADLAGRVAQLAGFRHWKDSAAFLVQMTSALAARTVPVAPIVTRAIVHYLLAGRFEDAIGRPAFASVADLTEAARLAASFEAFQAAAERIMARTEQTRELQYNQNYMLLGRAAAYARPKDPTLYSAQVARVVEHGKLHVPAFPPVLAAAALALARLRESREAAAIVRRVETVLEHADEAERGRRGAAEDPRPVTSSGRSRSESDRLRDSACVKVLVDDSALLLAAPRPSASTAPTRPSSVPPAPARPLPPPACDGGCGAVARMSADRGIPVGSNALNAIVQGLWRAGRHSMALDVRAQLSATRFPDSKLNPRPPSARASDRDREASTSSGGAGAGGFEDW
eukprot:tig00021244_g19572.t1